MAHEDRQLTSEEAIKDNEKRKREVTNKAGKQGILACTDIRTCEDSVRSNPQAEFKSPSEYVMMAMKETDS